MRVKRLLFPTIVLTVVSLMAIPATSSAQAGGGHAHTPGMSHDSAMAAKVPAPTRAGQEAFATIAEIVRILDADARTDWSKVDIEALRQHLIDMDDVTMRAEVIAERMEGGVSYERR